MTGVLDSDILEIAKLPNSILRQVSLPIEIVTEGKFQGLIDSMISTAKAANGVGIAAPQVFQSFRLFILASHPNPRYPDAPIMTPEAVINPSILSHGDEVVEGWEGCLSVPGFRGVVPRYKSIEVQYVNRFGDTQHRFFEGFVARIFQHELDHLNGILYVDRLKSQEDLVMVSQY